MSRKKKDSGGEVNGEAWLATYADTITLILTFFVLLYSYSTVDAVKFQQMSSAMQSILTGQNATSILDFNSAGQVPVVGPPQDLGPQAGGPQEEMFSKVKNFIDTNNLEDTVEIKRDSRGIIMELKDNILFDIGKADIKEPSKAILDKIGVLISSFPNNIIVEGHTDNVPISTYKFPSNWELSTQRAVNVLKYFVQTKGMNPIRFEAAGYGEYRPIASNDTYINRAKNRRVNILITASAGVKEKN